MLRDLATKRKQHGFAHAQFSETRIFLASF